jgi:hypothetical protein
MGGVFPLEFSPALLQALGAKKPKKKPDELIGLNCKLLLS